MVSRVLEIARLYLLTTYRSRSVVIFSFLIPLLFTYMIAQTMRRGDVPDRWTLDVVALDEGELGAALVNRLQLDPTLEVRLVDQAAAREDLAQGLAVGVLTVPEGVSAALARGDRAELIFQGAQGATRPAQVVQEAVRAAAAGVSGSLQAAEISLQVATRLGVLDMQAGESARALKRQAFSRAEALSQGAQPVVMSAHPVTRLERPEDSIPYGLEQSSPGMMVMFAMFFTLGGGVALIHERDEGTLRRLVVMPLRKGEIILGKFLGIYLAGILQIGLLILAGALLFHVSWGRSPAGLALLVAVFALAITSLGLVVGALARTAAQANALTTVVVLALAALGGAWWPLEIVPAWMRTLGHLFPTAWAMDGFHDLITRGLGAGAVAAEVAILAGYGLVFLTVGVWRFRYE